MWSCVVCGPGWVILMVNSRRFLDLLAVTVELAAARSVLGELLRLADQGPVLTEEQLWLPWLNVPHPGHSLSPGPRLAAGRARPPTRLPAANRHHTTPWNCAVRGWRVAEP